LGRWVWRLDSRRFLGSAFGEATPGDINGWEVDGPILQGKNHDNTEDESLGAWSSLVTLWEREDGILC